MPYFGALSLNDPLIQLLLNISRALLILGVALVLARVARRWVVRVLSRARGRVSLNTATLLGNLAQVGVMFLGVVSILPSFGVDWTGLLALVGAAGLAISLSMQDLLKNVIAGIYILMEQPFRIGDRITVKEATGVVLGIELRTTVLCTDENLQMIVPNNVVLTEIITNRSATDLKRQLVIVSTQGGNLTEMGRQITDALNDLEGIAATPPPATALEGIKEGIARLRVEFWVPSTERIAVTALVIERLRALYPGADVDVL
ncbi:MAG TPA: mechanosensitive ion channel domain-containing protein [Chloroflexia bacterium]|jgi:small-conductance mechanosensitive channel